MPEIIDISVGLESTLPVWPGSPKFRIFQTMRMEDGEVANVSQIETDVHIGTHVDAPWHFVRGGKTIEQLSLDILMGTAFVAYLPEVEKITAQDLERLTLPPNTQRLLVRTRNSQLWENKVSEFQTDFVAFTADAAQWIVERGIKLIGIDYLSVQRYYDDASTHQILLGAEVVIIEGLNLTNVTSGLYNLVCLPIKLLGAEGSPARAVLIKEDS